jgi:DNA-directed RNA polymerase specialized sigma24 family protein
MSPMVLSEIILVGLLGAAGGVLVFEILRRVSPGRTLELPVAPGSPGLVLPPVSPPFPQLSGSDNVGLFSVGVLPKQDLDLRFLRGVTATGSAVVARLGPINEVDERYYHGPSKRMPPHPDTGIGLTQDLFYGLLARLDTDRERAGYKYEDIRHNLIKLFALRGCSNPEELAAETISRAARRLSEGPELWVEDPAIYLYGVARNVLKEHLRLSRRQVAVMPLGAPQQISGGQEPDEEEVEAWLAHLDRLLRSEAALRTDLRALIFS